MEVQYVRCCAAAMPGPALHPGHSRQCRGGDDGDTVTVTEQHPARGPHCPPRTQGRRHQYGRDGNCHTWVLNISKTGDTMGKIRWHRGKKWEKMAKKLIKWAKKQDSPSLPSLPKWGNAAPENYYNRFLYVSTVKRCQTLHTSLWITSHPNYQRLLLKDWR